MSKLATPPHAINSNMSQVVDDANSTLNDAYDDASTLLDDNDSPLGNFVDEQTVRVIQHDVVESDDELELKLLKLFLELALLDMNCLRYQKAML